MKDAETYRKLAEEAQQQAARASSEVRKETWTRAAEEWLKLAGCG
jgi:hypothetical protein